MKTRLLAAVFVVCCLLLCGLILRRQIIAHPLPPETAPGFEDNQDGQGQGRYRMGMGGWQPASAALSALAHQTVAGQLSALKASDGPKAWEYQSRSLRQNFSSPAQFMQTIARQYPAFTRYRHVLYGPVLTDKAERQIRAAILLEGENEHGMRADYLLVRENGQLKVNGVIMLPRPDARQ